MSTIVTEQNKPGDWIENPKYKMWRAQVNANYHDGNMTAEEAEAAAGLEPAHYCCPICFRVDSNHMFDKRHYPQRESL